MSFFTTVCLGSGAGSRASSLDPARLRRGNPEDTPLKSDTATIIVMILIILSIIIIIISSSSSSIILISIVTSEASPSVLCSEAAAH